jgi:hypothetical protein
MTGTHSTLTERGTLQSVMGTDCSAGGSFWCERNVAYGVLLLCAVVALILHFWFMSSNSATADELVHVESGYRYWQCGDYGVSPENPPLAKLVAAFPVRHWQLGGFAGPCGSQVTTSRGPDYRVAIGWLMSPSGLTLLWKAHAAMALFALALLAITFFSAVSFFGYRVATVAAILLAFEPTIIAHGSLATIDVAFAMCMLAAIWAAYEFAIKPTSLRALLLGLAMGLALASKFLALSIPLVALVVISLPQLSGGLAWRELLSRCGGWIGACAVAWVVIWASYGFRCTALPHTTRASYDFSQIFASSGMADSFWPKLCWFLANHRLVPEAYIAGLATMKAFDASPAYFFGNVYPEGVWYYYPVALLIKLHNTGARAGSCSRNEPAAVAQPSIGDADAGYLRFGLFGDGDGGSGEHGSSPRSPHLYSAGAACRGGIRGIVAPVACSRRNWICAGCVSRAVVAVLRPAAALLCE